MHVEYAVVRKSWCNITCTQFLISGGQSTWDPIQFIFLFPVLCVSHLLTQSCAHLKPHYTNTETVPQYHICSNGPQHVHIPMTSYDSSGIFYLKLLPEVFQCHFLWLPKAEGISDVAYVSWVAQLWDPTWQHHGEQVDEERATVTQFEEGILTQTLEPAEGEKITESDSFYVLLTCPFGAHTYFANSGESLSPSLVIM